MTKLLEVQSTKDFAESFLNDIFFRMVVNRVLDNAPGFELVRCKGCKHYKPRNASAHWDGKALYCTRSAAAKFPPDGFCSFGERKDYDQETGEDHSGIR